MKDKQIKNQTRQNFLLTFFDGDNYQEKEVNGYWLIKQMGETGWNVAIYTKEAFVNRAKFKEGSLF